MAFDLRQPVTAQTIFGGAGWSPGDDTGAWGGAAAQDGRNTTLNTSGVNFASLGGPQPVAAPVAANGAGDWYNRIPEWTQGGGYNWGMDYRQGTGWVPKGPQAAGSLIGDEVGWRTGMYIPVGYDASRDTSGFEYNGRADNEKLMARAIRQTADYMRGNPGANAQSYLEYKLANLVRDTTAAGRQSGFDPSKFAQVAYGEAYDPNRTYMAPGVVNPWTGRPAGNAQGASTPSVAQAQAQAQAVAQGVPQGVPQGAPAPLGSGPTTPVRTRMVMEPEEAFSYLMRSKGFDPLNGGFATKYLRKYYMPDIQGLQQMAGNAYGGGGIPTAEITGLLDGLGNAMMSRGGGGTAGYVRGVADNAMRNAGGFLDSATDERAMGFLENANFLRNRGSNIAEDAAQQRFQQWQGEYSQDVNRTLSGDTGAPQTFREFMRRRGYGVGQPFR